MNEAEAYAKLPLTREEKIKRLTKRQREVLRLIELGLCFAEEIRYVIRNVHPVKYTVPSDLECTRWIDCTSVIQKLKAAKLVTRLQLPIARLYR